MQSHLPTNVQPAIEAARIAAQATIQAAQIAADAARTNTLISVGGTFLTLLGAAIAAYVAYTNAREPFCQANADREKERTILAAKILTNVRATIDMTKWTRHWWRIEE